MLEIVIGSLWTAAALYLGFHMGKASTADQISKLRRDNYYLKKWLDRQVRATIETDLDLEVERIRNA